MTEKEKEASEALEYIKHRFYDFYVEYINLGIHLNRAKKRIPKLIKNATDAEKLTKSMEKMDSHLTAFFVEMEDSGIDFYSVERTKI